MSSGWFASTTRGVRTTATKAGRDVNVPVGRPGHGGAGLRGTAKVCLEPGCARDRMARDTGKILATTLLGTMDTNALVPIIALYAATLGADVVQVGIIVGLYSAVHAPANLLFGRLADRWGRVRPLRIGLIWDAASMVLYAVAGSPLALALARVSHGIGGGLVGPSTMAVASR